jgi:hypothetical protein
MTDASRLTYFIKKIMTGAEEFFVIKKNNVRRTLSFYLHYDTILLSFIDKEKKLNPTNFGSFHSSSHILDSLASSLKFSVHYFVTLFAFYNKERETD